ncbi:MAG: diguanylate cyclase, partial [Deltaproteobacteria bacterium]|nr:diguanylate cyclase [Deltaproteobacteria bacterium]
MVAAMLVAGGLFSWWTGVRTDSTLRADLVRQARLVAQGLDIERIRSLSGTKEDLDTPAYLWLKNQLARVRAATPQYRFVYLMGRRPDGRLFFFADDRPFGDAEESQAGEIYDDAPEEFRRVFETGVADAGGPYTDKWGSFVSGAVPVVDPETGNLLAVLAVDLDARAWKWEVAASASLPVGLMLTLLI